MDNLTHSLVGALIGQAGLKRKTGLAMPALIVGANIPDVDAACMLWLHGVEPMGVRRGITHGPIAWVLLPLVLAGLLYGYDRWQAKRGKRPEGRLPVHFGWLYALGFIACLTHPAMDWLNVYGIRLLEPFSSRWFYGDVLFIVDIWLWLGLGFATWFSLRREKRSGEWRRPARIALSIAGLYIFANGILTGMAERQGAALVEHAYGLEPTLVVGSPRPVLFWQREILWRWEDPKPEWFGAIYGQGLYSPFSAAELYEPPGYDRWETTTVTWSSGRRHWQNLIQWFGMPQSRFSQLVECNPDLRPFLFWSRMPIRVPWNASDTEPAIIQDQRFMDPIANRFSVPVTPCAERDAR